MLPLDDAQQFAQALEVACDRVILDHYLLGDGSPGGQRTKKTALPPLLESTGYSEWTELQLFNHVVEIFRQVFKDRDRVGISQSGFNNDKPLCSTH